MIEILRKDACWKDVDSRWVNALLLAQAQAMALSSCTT